MPSAKTPREYRILRFLRRKPMPAKVSGVTLDGEELKVVVGEGAGAMSDTVSALVDCVKIMALDRDGNLIRRLDLEPDEDLEDLEDKPRRGEVISIDVPKLVDNIARNMREVASSSASQQANAFKEGFSAMTSVVNLCLSLLVRVDRRLEEIEAQSVPAPADNQSLAMLALQKALGQQSAPTAPPNGGQQGGISLSPEIIQSLISQFGGGDTNGSG